MKTIYFVLVFLILSFFLAATIINVPGDQPTIQAGIDVAVDSDTVLVQPGTYFENIDYIGKNITVASLFLTTQDTTYISQTIIDGNQNGSVVTFHNGEDSTAVLTGFTITNGLSTPGGGGISCWSSSPTIHNMIIMNNATYSGDGGGIYCSNSSPSLENVIVTGNYSISGGGIKCNNSSPSISNVTIIGNSANEGGGIHCEDYSSPSLVDVIIIGNSATYFGGGIVCFWYSSPSLENVIITDNNSTSGGGIVFYSSNLTLENVIIKDNSSVYGGGIDCSYSSPTLLNVTVTGNSASFGGGIYCMVGSDPDLVNCILWNDSPEEIYFDPAYDPNSITISYSDIQDGEAGIVINNNGTVNWLEGNIDEDPLFVGTGGYPYSLLEDSPCIDAGIPDTTGLNLPPWDIIGNLRIWDGDGNGSAIIDMGAYEYGAPPYVDIDDNVIVQTPEVFLHQNYPNPFNPTTTINYSLKENSKVSLNIYNIKGQKVKQLVRNQLSAGQHSVVWNGKDDNGKSVSSGIYFYKLKAGNFEKTKKMILMK